HRFFVMLLMAPRDAFSLEGVTWDGHVDCTRLQQELRKRATGELPRRSLAGRAVGPYAHACLPRLAKCLVDGLIKRQCPPCRLCPGEGLCAKGRLKHRDGPLDGRSVHRMQHRRQSRTHGGSRAQQARRMYGVSPCACHRREPVQPADDSQLVAEPLAERETLLIERGRTCMVALLAGDVPQIEERNGAV